MQKCDRCEKRATNHSVEIRKGQKVEKHLCDECAAKEGMIKSAAHTPINELLTNFVKMHSSARTTSAVGACDNCGLTFEQFQERKLLGCPHCYTAFDRILSPLLERAHEGGDHHVGKAPRRAAGAEYRQEQLLRMRKRMGDAISAEDYELAAHLRDEIKRFESGEA